MRIPHLALAAVMLGFAVFVVVSARELDYLTPLGPGPGFFPRWLAGLLAVLSFVLAIDAARRPPEKARVGLVPDAADARRIGSVLGGLVVATAALPIAGFGLCLFALNLGVLAVLGRRGVVATSVALIGSFGVEFLFTAWLAVPLPKGWFSG